MTTAGTTGQRTDVMDLEARGPEQIRTAFTTAIATTTGHADDLTGIARVLGDAADRYATLQMTASTLAHLHDGATAVTAAAAALHTAGEQLQAALVDFDARDGQVGDAVAAAGNLMRPEAYTTPFTTTEQPMTSPTTPTSPSPDQTAAGDSAPDAAEERPDRERLARGFYLSGWSGAWQRDRAREWDAGRVEPQFAADAYEVADAVLAARAKLAGGRAAARMEAMRAGGVTRCPSWCTQIDDEDEWEEHVGPVRTLTTDDGATAAVRPKMGWWEQATPAAEITLTPGPGDARSVVLSTADLTALQQLSDQVCDDDPTQDKPSYPGATYDEADATWNVSAPATAAEDLDLKHRASGLYLNDTEDGPYLDWSSRNTTTRTRSLEVSDGDDTASIPLSNGHLRRLRDGIGRLVGAVHDGESDPGALYPDAVSDDVYIDWSVAEDGVRSIEFNDGVSATVLEMPEPQLREWYTRLALQVQLDEQDDAS